MKRLKKTICIVLCIISISLFGCTRREQSIMDGYRDFIENYDKYETGAGGRGDSGGDNPDKPADEHDTEIKFNVSGFTTISDNAYDSVEVFSENTALGYCHGHILLITPNREIQIDFIRDKKFGDVELINEFYIVSSGAQGKSLYGTDGKAITSKLYVNISIFSNVAICYDEEKTDVVINGRIVHSDVSNNISLLTNTYCIDNETNSVLLVSDLSVVRIGGLPVAYVPSDGTAVVKRDNKFGYASTATNSIIIEPQYFTASAFSCDYATVRKSSSADYPIIIDKAGNEIFDFGKQESIKKYNALDIHVFPCFDGVVIFEAKYLNSVNYGYINLKDPSKPGFSFVSGNPMKNRAFGNYLIIQPYNKLLDLSADDNLVDLEADDIFPAKDGFLVKRNATYSLIDYDLSEIVSDVEYLNYGNGLYTVGYLGKYFLCTKQ